LKLFEICHRIKLLLLLLLWENQR